MEALQRSLVREQSPSRKEAAVGQSTRAQAVGVKERCTLYPAVAGRHRQLGICRLMESGMG